ncbi:MAG: GatB/YqeY domain-containing protein [Pseudomonadota bacterium]
MAHEALRDRLQHRYRDAATGDDVCEAGTLRLILTAIRDRDRAAAETGADPIPDDAIRIMLSEMVEQRRADIARSECCAQLERAEREANEIEVIEDFLPKRLSVAEMSKAVDKAIRETAAQGLRDAGRVVQVLRSQYRGALDLCAAKKMICERLPRA